MRGARPRARVGDQKVHERAAVQVQQVRRVGAQKPGDAGRDEQRPGAVPSLPREQAAGDEGQADGEVRDPASRLVPRVGGQLRSRGPGRERRRRREGRRALSPEQLGERGARQLALRDEPARRGPREARPVRRRAPARDTSTTAGGSGRAATRSATAIPSSPGSWTSTSTIAGRRAPTASIAPARPPPRRRPRIPPPRAGPERRPGTRHGRRRSARSGALAPSSHATVRLSHQKVPASCRLARRRSGRSLPARNACAARGSSSRRSSASRAGRAARCRRRRARTR